MAFIKNNSLVNDILFRPPPPTYTNDLGICYVNNNICCLFLVYDDGIVRKLTTTTKIGNYPVIIVCHGNACDIGGMDEFGHKMSEVCKCHVVLYEYPGYGMSVGIPNENSCVDGLMDVIEHLNYQMKVPIQNMILYGQSIGSGVATVCYKNCKMKFGYCPSGLVLVSPYLSIRTLKDELMPTSSMIPIVERFDTKENIKHCDTGLLLIHGTDDTLIPVEHSNILYKNADCPIKKKDILLGRGHNDIPMERIIDKCNELLKDISIYFVKATYINKMGWMRVMNDNNYKGSSCKKVVATCMEPCMATSQKVYDCTLF